MTGNWQYSCTFETKGLFMRLKQVNTSRRTVDIHPYVQNRLRTLPRQDLAAGILLGSSENGVTHVTGFKRVPPNALRQAADAAGPQLAGFYRLQTQESPALLPEEVELWRDTQQNGRGLFLLVNGTNGTAAQATAWTKEGNGEPAAETISLNNDPPLPPPELPYVPPVSAARFRIPWRAVIVSAFAIVAIAAAIQFWPIVLTNPGPNLALDLQSRNGELIAAWEEKTGSTEPLQSATITIKEGDKAQTIDLAPNYTPKGRIVLRPQSRDVIVTLNVQYANSEMVSRAATYIGFARTQPAEQFRTAQANVAPPTQQFAPSRSRNQQAQAASPADPSPELIQLRKRNKELEEAAASSAELAQLRKRNSELESTAAAASNSSLELSELRKRNKELEEAVAALKKHIPH
ncbi:MAG: hypothetical protein HYX27_16900 [Acidobacteria bacterium]|nr:hypothetical protein [Acidobacteriota bacterium]